MITLPDFYKGRDKEYAKYLTPSIQANAVVTIDRVNLLLTKYRIASRDYNPHVVTSGWRPPPVNTSAKGGVRSKHLTGRAIDLEDKGGRMDAWLMTPEGEVALKDCQLWHEHPRDTEGWVHVQTVAPASGRLHFYAH